MFSIATWNVNSLTIRLPQVLAWLVAHQPDVLALQETKLIDEKFPISAFSEIGYQVAFSGQPTYNGVALCSKHPIHSVVTEFSGFHDPQRRLLAATVQGFRIVNVYIPNGSELGSEKYRYKLQWLAQLKNFLEQALKAHPQLILLGDFNIAPADIDVHDPLRWKEQVLCSREEREALQSLSDLGLIDSFRHLYPDVQGFTWWDYRLASFKRDLGLRIDHIFISKALAPACTVVNIDKVPRQHERPSDHAPVWLSLKSP